jgi:hypothetical protein
VNNGILTVVDRDKRVSIFLTGLRSGPQLRTGICLLKSEWNGEYRIELFAVQLFSIFLLCSLWYLTESPLIEETMMGRGCDQIVPL